MLEVGRGNRTILYNIKAVRPPPLVPRSRVYEVDERTLYDGTVVPRARPGRGRARSPPRSPKPASRRWRSASCTPTPTTPTSAPRATRSSPRSARRGGLDLVRGAAGISGVRAVHRDDAQRLCRPAHARLSRRARNRAVAARLSPRHRDHDLERRHLAGAADRRATPVHSVLSGPAAGVIGAVEVGTRGRVSATLITYDMGGTSTDACLVRERRSSRSRPTGVIGAHPDQAAADRHQQHRRRRPASIAYLDAGKAIAVGPRSRRRGAGPGRLRPRRHRAHRDRRQPRARPPRHRAPARRRDPARPRAGRARRSTGWPATVGLDRRRMAEGILAIVDRQDDRQHQGNLDHARPRPARLRAVRLWRRRAAARGRRSPTSSACPRVLVPPLPGNFSAFGLLVADVRHDYVRTRVVADRRDCPFAELQAALRADARAGPRARSPRTGSRPSDMRFEARLDMRYVGQAFELPVAVPDDGRVDRRTSTAPSSPPTSSAIPMPTGAGRDRDLPPRRLWRGRQARHADGADRRLHARRRPRRERAGRVRRRRSRPTPVYDRDRCCPAGSELPARRSSRRPARRPSCRPAGPRRLDAARHALRTGASRVRWTRSRSKSSREALISVVREMRATVCRTASSVAIYEAKDFSCGLFDAGHPGRRAIRGHRRARRAAAWSVKFAMEKFGGDLAPGDVILLNDPYRRRHASQRRHADLSGLSRTAG